VVISELKDQTARRYSGIVEPLAAGYTAGWTALLAVAAVCALIPAARWAAHHVLSLDLHVHIRPASPPTLSGAVGLLVTNVRATCWPLLAATLGAGRSTRLRRVTHVAVAVSLAVNLLPVAAAVGVYRAQLVPYLPHLPLELYAITTGPATWVICTRQTLSRRQIALIAVSMVLALAGAALLETWAVPHR
jgi:hypothetical protein